MPNTTKQFLWMKRYLQKNGFLPKCIQSIRVYRSYVVIRAYQAEFVHTLH